MRTRPPGGPLANPSPIREGAVSGRLSIVKLPIPPVFLRRFWAGLHANHLRSRGLVISGPFAGMKYVDGSVGSQYWPKLFGTYEVELDELWPELDRAEFDRVVDVGAAEGYYAVGCARRWPEARVIAFETEEEGRRLLAGMAGLNGVADRIEIHGRADVSVLREAFGRNSNGSGTRVLCIMDIEGGERELCDPALIPALGTAHLLVETHEFAVPGINDLLKNRFARTHDALAFRPRGRTLKDFEGRVPGWLRLALGRNLIHVVDEWRTPNCGWLYFAPRPPQ